MGNKQYKEHDVSSHSLANRRSTRDSLNFFFSSVNNLPFSLPRDHHHKLANVLEEKRFAPNTFIIKEGQKAKGLYVVLDGKCKVTSSHVSYAINILHGGDIFGEISCLYKQPSTCSVITEELCTTMFLSKKYVKKIPRKVDTVTTCKEWFLKQKYLDCSNVFQFDISTNIVESSLLHTAIFNGWSDEPMKMLLSNMSKPYVQIHQPGSLISLCDNELPHAYLLIKGEVKVILGNFETHLSTSKMDPIIFGEELLFTNNLCSVSVYAESICQVIDILPKHFSEVLKCYPVEGQFLKTIAHFWCKHIESRSRFYGEFQDFLQINFLVFNLLKLNVFSGFPQGFVYLLALNMRFVLVKQGKNSCSAYAKQSAMIVLKGEVVHFNQTYNAWNLFLLKDLDRTEIRCQSNGSALCGTFTDKDVNAANQFYPDVVFHWNF